MKNCFKCLRSLDESAFYGHPSTADRLSGKCKDCTKKDVRSRYAAMREQRSSYERKRCGTPHRRAQALDAQQRRRQRNPDKYAARTAVSNAIRDGRLKRQGCEVCGQRAEAHHSDYSKPLEVQWLCFEHHRAQHGQVVVKPSHKEA